MIEPNFARRKVVHRHAWLWEPMEAVPSIELRSMFGVKTAYIDGNILLGFAANKDPWRGVLICTEHKHHASLMEEFPALSPHPVVPKWLMVRESHDDFERVAGQLVALATRRDPRIEVTPAGKKRKVRN